MQPRFHVEGLDLGTENSQTSSRNGLPFFEKKIIQGTGIRRPIFLSCPILETEVMDIPTLVSAIPDGRKCRVVQPTKPIPTKEFRHIGGNFFKRNGLLGIPFDLSVERVENPNILSDPGRFPLSLFQWNLGFLLASSQSGLPEVAPPQEKDRDFPQF